jgi:hypothetical protein
MAIVNNSAPDLTAFPTILSNPSVAQTLTGVDYWADVYLDLKEIYIEANGYTVDRNTGAVTVT